MKNYNIRLSISDEANTVISRYYLKKVTNLMHVIQALNAPMHIEGKKLVLVDMVDIPKRENLIRGMLEYNMYLIAHLLKIDAFDGCLVALNRFPKADVHVSLGIHKQKLNLIINHMEKSGGTPFYQGPFREFAIDKCIKGFQYYFDD